MILGSIPTRSDKDHISEDEKQDHEDVEEVTANGQVGALVS